VNPSDIAATLFHSFMLIIPEGILGLAACVLFLGATIRANRHVWAVVALISLAAAGVAVALTYAIAPPSVPTASPLVHDRLALFTRVLALAGGAILVLLSWNEVPDQMAAEYHACLLITVAGLGLTGAANELVTLFLSLELISIPSYILLYLPSSEPRSREAAVKYFLLSIFSSAMLLFGFSYLYGLGGTTNLSALMDVLVVRGEPQALPAVAQVALIMVVAGLGFKITAVPFHFYAPDVYQGAPTAPVAFLAFIPKVAGFVALLRVLGFLWTGEVAPGLALGVQVPILFWILAAMTMTLGNVLGLLQDNLKRLLAYSSVAHAGYMLIGLAVTPDLSYSDGGPILGGVEAVLFYLAAYGAMTIGAFAVLSYLSTPQRPVETVDDLAGLSSSHPGVALLMAVFLFSLIGIPLTAGFAGKFLLFFGAMAVPSRPPLEEHAWLFRGLALVAALNAAIAAWYYLRILAAMYLRTPLKPLTPKANGPGLATIWLCAALTLGIGVYPWPLLQQAVQAVKTQPSPGARAER
jgi:NADH-quinone oxidoreductase subunit N